MPILKLLLSSLLVIILSALFQKYGRNTLTIAAAGVGALCLVLFWRDIFGSAYWPLASTAIVGLAAFAIVATAWWTFVLPRFALDEAVVEPNAPPVTRPEPTPPPAPTPSVAPANESPKAPSPSKAQRDLPPKTESREPHPRRQEIVVLDPKLTEQETFEPLTPPNARLKAGDLVITDKRSVSVVDPDTGKGTMIAAGGYLRYPRGVGIDHAGAIYVADAAAFGVGGLLRIDPASGRQTILFRGGPLQHHYAIAVASPGALLLSGLNSGNVARFDSRTAELALVVAGGGALRSPRGLSTADGYIYIADAQSQILRVDVATSRQTLVSSAGLLQSPMAILRVGKDLFVTDQQAKAVIRIAPDGTQHSVAKDGHLRLPYGLVARHGKLLIADGQSGLVEVEPTTGEQRLVATDLKLEEATGLALVVPPG